MRKPTSIGLYTSKGPRSNNEDSAIAKSYEEHEGNARFLCLCAVADGMGGHNAGEIASGTTVRMLSQKFEERTESRVFKDNGEIAEMLCEIVQEINRDIFHMGKSAPSYKGMGNTLTFFTVYEGVLSLAHVGDSRAYLIRSSSATQITEDHTLVESMVRKKMISREEASSRPDRNIILRALGISSELEVDSLSIEIEPGDLIILCTDGLYESVSDERIVECCLENEDMQTLTEELVAIALESGTRDNCTVVAWKYMPNESKNIQLSFEGDRAASNDFENESQEAPLLENADAEKGKSKKRNHLKRLIYLSLSAVIIALALLFILLV